MLNRLAQSREGEPSGEPFSKAAWSEPRPPRITQAHSAEPIHLVRQKFKKKVTRVVRNGAGGGCDRGERNISGRSPSRPRAEPS